MCVLLCKLPRPKSMGTPKSGARASPKIWRVGRLQDYQRGEQTAPKKKYDVYHICVFLFHFSPRCTTTPQPFVDNILDVHSHYDILLIPLTYLLHDMNFVMISTIQYMYHCTLAKVKGLETAECAIDSYPP